MDIGSMIQEVTGGGNAESLAQAAEQHLGSMAPEEVTQHLQTAAGNASQNGQPDVAQEIQGMIANKQVDPEGLKNAAISYIKSNPQVLTHFAPAFAQGLLNRVI
ncbi:MAG: hypothetical protein M3N19_06670 [Candidatus Eremiobacteraeota bacterium]|nr:hypothetical protein [Candidatus Eremiobacteraeota bacterium]